MVEGTWKALHSFHTNNWEQTLAASRGCAQRAGRQVANPLSKQGVHRRDVCIDLAPVPTIRAQWGENAIVANYVEMVSRQANTERNSIHDRQV